MMKNDKILQKLFDELTLETSCSSSCDRVSGEWTSYSGSFDPEKSVASRSDTIRSYGEPTYQTVKDSYHQNNRSIKKNNPMVQLSSIGTFDFDQRNEKRSAAPTPRRVTQISLNPRSLTPNICDRLKGMGVHLNKERIRRKAAEEIKKSVEVTSYSDSFDPDKSVASRSDTTRSSRSYKSSQSSLFDEEPYNVINHSYDRSNKCENPASHFSSQGSFDCQRNNLYLSKRSVSPTPRGVRIDRPFELSSERSLDYRSDFNPSIRSATPTPRSVPTRTVAPRSLNPNICDRLYRMGVHTQKEKAKKERIRKKTDEEEEIKKQNDPLQINRSFTPKKLRPYENVETKYKKYSSVHEYLYRNATERQIGKEKISEERAEKIEDTSIEKNRGKKLLSPREKNKVIDRLYERSKLQQSDGKERRMKIAKAIAPKPKLPERTISVNKSIAMYNRLVARQKVRDRKLEAARNIR